MMIDEVDVHTRQGRTQSRVQHAANKRAHGQATGDAANGNVTDRDPTCVMSPHLKPG